MWKPTIVLADDDAVLMEILKRMLKSDFEVLASVTDGWALLEAAKRLGPDVIISDISMPRLNGFRAARQLRIDQPAARIIFLTVHDEPEFIAAGMKIGALGYVIKQSAGSDLIPAIREALQGRSFLSPSARRDSRPSIRKTSSQRN